MNRPKHIKPLVYLLILVLLSANQAVFATVFVDNDHQNGSQADTMMVTHADDDHHDANTNSPSHGNHDHQNSDCDGFDNCNHCVNLLNNFASNKVSILSSFIPGAFATYYDIYLPSDIRPPQNS